jgi:hypothetical protein
VVGVPGRSGGQNRKRTEQKLGKPHVAQDSPDHHDNVDKPFAEPVVQPPLVFPDVVNEKTGRKVKWVPSEPIQSLWDSMGASGFHEYFTRSDWDAALTQMMRLDMMVRAMCRGEMLPANQGAEMRAIFQDLLVLESARRRLKIEVQRHKDTVPPLAAVAPLDRARASGL